MWQRRGGCKGAKDAGLSFGLCEGLLFLEFVLFCDVPPVPYPFFKSEGVSAVEIGMLLGVQRVLDTVTTLLWACLADKTKRARFIVQASLVAGVLPFLALAVPVTGSNKVLPRAIGFWMFALCGSPQAALRDALAIAACAGDSDLWGRARVYGAIGWGLMHLLMGPLLDVAGFAVLFVGLILLFGLLWMVTRVSVPQACSDVKTEVTVRALLDIFSRNRLCFINMAAIGAGFSMVEGMFFCCCRSSIHQHFYVGCLSW